MSGARRPPTTPAVLLAIFRDSAEEKAHVPHRAVYDRELAQGRRVGSVSTAPRWVNAVVPLITIPPPAPVVEAGASDLPGHRSPSIRPAGSPPGYPRFRADPGSRESSGQRGRGQG